MATFKVGQRVRVIAIDPRDSGTVVRVGDEGTVIAPFLPLKYQHDYIVRIDRFGDWFEFYSRELSPLTDPKADEFIALLKNLGNITPLTDKQLEEVRGA